MLSKGRGSKKLMRVWMQGFLRWARVWKGRILRWSHVLGQILYGMTIYEIVRDLNKERGKLERMFVLFVFSDMLGIPILTPYYSLRLLPYVMPSIMTWKISLLRERDLTDLCDHEIG